jgi:hypothetical protein
MDGQNENCSLIFCPSGYSKIEKNFNNIFAGGM